MKKSILSLLFFSFFSFSFLNLNARCIRAIDQNANGSFKVRHEKLFGDDYIICEADEEACQTCPKCPPASSQSNYDPKDNTAMNALFTQADDAVFNQGSYSGNISATYWVQGKNQARIYNVTWSINLNGLVEMIFDRIS
jgi:hypothetical protein